MATLPSASHNGDCPMHKVSTVTPPMLVHNIEADVLTVSAIFRAVMDVRANGEQDWNFRFRMKLDETDQGQIRLELPTTVARASRQWDQLFALLDRIPPKPAERKEP